jgi:hypothetical protein
VSDLAASAASEWAGLVTAAVLGTDRRPLPPATDGWEPAVRSSDPAVQLLDRAAAVATARRAGVQPGPAVARLAPPPVDERPACSAAAALQLARLLRGEHDLLLAEWFARCERAGMRPPPHLTPALLLRGRRQPALDIAARRVIGPLAAWLAEAMPELGLKALPAPLPAGVDPLLPPTPPADSAAVVSALVGTFLDGTATWAAAGQLRLAVAAIDPALLAALAQELGRAPFRPETERTRVDLLGLAQLRIEILRELAAG